MALLPNGLIMKPEPCPLESKLLPEHSKIDRPPILSTLMRTPAAMAAAAVAAAAGIKQQTAALQKTDQIHVATLLPTITKMESSPPAKELSKSVKRKRSSSPGARRLSSSRGLGYTFSRLHRMWIRRLVARNLKLLTVNHISSRRRMLNSSTRLGNTAYRPPPDPKDEIHNTENECPNESVQKISTIRKNDKMVSGWMQNLKKCVQVLPKVGNTKSTNVENDQPLSVSSSSSDGSSITQLPFPTDEPCEVIHHRAVENPGSEAHSKRTSVTTGATHPMLTSVVVSNPQFTLPQVSFPNPNGFNSSPVALLSVLPTASKSVSVGFPLSQPATINKTIASIVNNPAVASELWSKIQLLLESAKNKAPPNQANAPPTSVLVSAPTSSFWTNPPNEVVMSTGQENLPQSVRLNPSNVEVTRKSTFAAERQAHPKPVITSVKSLNPSFRPPAPVSMPSNLMPPSIPLASSSTPKSSPEITVASSSVPSNLSERPPTSTTIRPGQIHRLLLRETDGLTFRDTCPGDLAIVYLGHGCWRPLLLPPEVDLVTKSKAARAKMDGIYTQPQTQQETVLQNRQQQRCSTDNLQPKPSQSIRPPLSCSSASYTPSVIESSQVNGCHTPSISYLMSGHATQGCIGMNPNNVPLIDWTRQQLTSNSPVAVHPVLVELLPPTMRSSLSAGVPSNNETVCNSTKATTTIQLTTPTTTLDQSTIPRVASMQQTYTLIPIHISADALNRQSVDLTPRPVDFNHGLTQH